MTNNDLQTITKKLECLRVEFHSMMYGINVTQKVQINLLAKILMALGMETPSVPLSELCGGRKEVHEWLQRVNQRKDC